MIGAIKNGFLAALVAVLVLAAGTAWANHRGDNTVLVAGAISQTGRYSEPAGRVYNSVRLWVKQANAAGGLLGHKIELRMLDDKSDKQTSIKLYEKLITEDKADLLLAPYSSGITDAVANVTERYHMPMIAYAGASSVIWQKGRKYIFNIIDIAENYQKGAAHLAAELGVKRIAIIGEDSLFPRMTRKGLEEVWAPKLGLQVVLAENYPRTQTDFTALLQKIKARRAEAIFSDSYFADAVAQIRQMRELNINVKMFSGTVGPGLPRFAKDLGDTAEFVLGFTQWEPVVALGHPGMQPFIDAYNSEYGVMPNYHAGQSYGSMQVFEAAVKKAGSFDKEKVRNALASLDINTMFGRFKVNEQGLNSHEGLTFQILKGKRRVVWPAKSREVAPVLPMPEWGER